MGAIPARPGPILLLSVPYRIGSGQAETDVLATSEFNNLGWSRIAISCAPCRIQNPCNPQNTPRYTFLVPSPETKIRKKFEKCTKIGEFRIFLYFFRSLVSGEESGCILGCIRGVLYSARGAKNRKSRTASNEQMRPKIGISACRHAEERTEQLQRCRFQLQNFGDPCREIESVFAPLPPQNEEATQVFVSFFRRFNRRKPNLRAIVAVGTGLRLSVCVSTL